jgi:D-alanyl-D-alanine carboxypeptidase
MKYTKALNIILIFPLLFACENKGNEASNKIETEEINLSKEIRHPEIDSLINNMISEEHFTGVVLVAVNDKIIHGKGYGMAQDGIQNRIDTKFHVASITKQFTAAAIMQLLEQKKINLEESINEFLPSQYRSDKWNSLTIHHLLTQTSGIEDYGLTRDYYEVEKGFCLGNTVDGMIKEAIAKELKFPSGSKFSYSNIGYTLLGQIIEKTSGEPYDSYMKRYIFEPMGMHDSFIHNISTYTLANDEAMGYRWDDELNIHVPDDIIGLPVTEPDGNLVTTLNDFLKWTSIYTNNNQKVIDDIAIKKMTTPYIKNDFSFLKEKGPWYGYGLSLTDGIISHPGHIVGFRSHFIVDTNNGIKVLVFNNNVSNNPVNISSKIYNMISKN